MIQLLWKMVWRFLKKRGRKPPYDPAIPLPGVHTEETRAERNTGTPVFTAARFTVARTRKQPRCASMDKEVVVHIHNGIALS